MPPGPGAPAGLGIGPKAAHPKHWSAALAPRLALLGVHGPAHVTRPRQSPRDRLSGPVPACDVIPAHGRRRGQASSDRPVHRSSAPLDHHLFPVRPVRPSAAGPAACCPPAWPACCWGPPPSGAHAPEPEPVPRHTRAAPPPARPASVPRRLRCPGRARPTARPTAALLTSERPRRHRSSMCPRRRLRQGPAQQSNASASPTLILLVSHC